MLTQRSIDVLPAGGDGVITPLRSLGLPVGVGGFQVSLFRNELYVANIDASAIHVLRRTPAGR